MSDNEIKLIETWAIVELMGHVKTAGKVSEEPHFGTVLLRIDIPEHNSKQAHTEFHGGQAIFRLTPCDEQIARMVLAQTFTPPIVNFALPKPQMGMRGLFVQPDENEGDDEEDI